MRNGFRPSTIEGHPAIKIYQEVTPGFSGHLLSRKVPLKGLQPILCVYTANPINLVVRKGSAGFSVQVSSDRLLGGRQNQVPNSLAQSESTGSDLLPFFVALQGDHLAFLEATEEKVAFEAHSMVAKESGL